MPCQVNEEPCPDTLLLPKPPPAITVKMLLNSRRTKYDWRLRRSNKNVDRKNGATSFLPLISAKALTDDGRSRIIVSSNAVEKIRKERSLGSLNSRLLLGGLMWKSQRQDENSPSNQSSSTDEESHADKASESSLTNSVVEERDETVMAVVADKEISSRDGSDNPQDIQVHETLVNEIVIDPAWIEAPSFDSSQRNIDTYYMNDVRSEEEASSRRGDNDNASRDEAETKPKTMTFDVNVYVTSTNNKVIDSIEKETGPAQSKAVLSFEETVELTLAKALLCAKEVADRAGENVNDLADSFFHMTGACAMKVCNKCNDPGEDGASPEELGDDNDNVLPKSFHEEDHHRHVSIAIEGLEKENVNDPADSFFHMTGGCGMKVCNKCNHPDEDGASPEESDDDDNDVLLNSFHEEDHHRHVSIAIAVLEKENIVFADALDWSTIGTGRQ